MKFTLNWLKEFLQTDRPLSEISHRLTMLGLEVEGIEDNSATLAPFLIASVDDLAPHPNADKLNVCTVNAGEGFDNLQVVCGAPNVYKGMKTVIAMPGVYVPGLDFVIKKAKIRDVESNGMLCSGKELGIADEAEGILDLPSDAPVGKCFAAHYGYDDPVIEIGLTPNRSDCFGVEGVARELAAANVGKFTPLHGCNVSSTYASPIDINIEDTEACPVYYGMHIKGVKNGQSPEWLRRRLRQVGLKSISAAVDVTNYINFHLCRPLHVFDAGKLNGNIIVRRPEDGEKIVALDEKEYTLKNELVVADEKGAVAIAGVMGGLDSGVTEETTEIFLESAYFDPIAVSEAGRRLNIHSDSRTRFERGVDPQGTMRGLIAAAEMIIEFCGGEASYIVKAGDEPNNTRKLKLPYQNIRNLLGQEVPTKTVHEVLEAVGCKILHKDSMEVSVRTPSWRHDLSIPQDLIEEVARVVGYTTIKEKPPRMLLSDVKRSPSHEKRMKIRTIMAANGFDECITYAFLPQREAELFEGGQPELQLLNPISSDLSTMRPSLLPNLINVARRNIAKSHKSVASFELGEVYEGPAPEQQKIQLAAVMCGPKAPPHWEQPRKSFTVFDAKAAMLMLLRDLGLPLDKLSFDTHGLPSWYHPVQSAAVKLGPKNIIGFFGALSPVLLNKMDVEDEMFAFEVFVENLPASKGNKVVAPKVELTPIERDFSFVMHGNTPVDEAVKAIQSAERTLISDVHVFDVYEGKGVETGFKAVAFKAVIQPTEKTLSDAEIQEVCQKIINNVEKRTESKLRA